MKEKFKQWFGLDDPETIEPMDISHAAAALMVEIMAADDQWDDEEAAEIARLLQTELSVPADKVSEILTEAKERRNNASDLYQFTRVVNEHYSYDQKYSLMVQLWRVAYVDGQIDRYEEHSLRKLSELLHLAHSQFIRAKIEARDGIDPSTTS